MMNIIFAFRNLAVAFINWLGFGFGRNCTRSDMAEKPSRRFWGDRAKAEASASSLK